MQPTLYFSKSKSQGFFRTLHSRVNQYFVDNNIAKTGDIRMHIKTLVMLSLYFVPFVLVVTQVVVGWWVLAMYVLMGVGMSGIGLCIMHDANHGSYSSVPWINKLMSYTINTVGGSSFTWKIQHNVLHHTFTNIYELDEDIDDKPFLRLSPHGKWKPYHRFQHIYALFVYSLATLSWSFYKDFKQYVQYYREDIIEKNGFNPTRELLAMIGYKAAYFAILLALPILLGVPVYLVLLGFLVMHLISGVYITTVFQLAHVVEGPSHTAVSVEPETLENTWAIHQLQTTANFSTRSKFVTWMSGGLNHQIEHHLFPNICHVHYPDISKIVRDTVAEFNLPYYEHQRFGVAVASHLRMLKAFGTLQPASV